MLAYFNNGSFNHEVVTVKVYIVCILAAQVG